MRDRFEAQMASYLNRLGDRLIDLRTEAGYTQEALARELDVATRTVQNWEAGLAHPYRRNLRALEKVYELRAGTLAEDEPVIDHPHLEERLEEIDRKLDEVLEILKPAEDVRDAADADDVPDDFRLEQDRSRDVQAEPSPG